MEIAYWIVAGLLAAFYLYAGGKKAVQSQERLAPMMGWVDTVPMGLVRVIGTVEILGAAGLVLPPLTGIAPVLAGGGTRPARAPATGGRPAPVPGRGQGDRSQRRPDRAGRRGGVARHDLVTPEA